MRVGGIDPGARFFAWAYFEGEGVFQFANAGIQLHSSAVSSRRFVEVLNLETLAVEKPQVYAGKAKGDNNDLIDLAIVVGACAAATSSILVTPRHWKGTIKKEPHHTRLRSKLANAENAALNEILLKHTKKKQLDILDAVGLAAWACGRNK